MMNTDDAVKMKSSQEYSISSQD